MNRLALGIDAKVKDESDSSIRHVLGVLPWIRLTNHLSMPAGAGFSSPRPAQRHWEASLHWFHLSAPWPPLTRRAHWERR
ncbi:hypothetical protein BURKHO8Y_270025 [Burkholderia sp. 8Y]|nr:hypothetical protein BURKHO8Y_270025 [Burkholderia sp. 8Y]